MYLIIVAIINIFVLSWLVRAFKSALFWIYLWQLKEYHVGRFIDHFRTFKGKNIFLNFFTYSKFILLFSFFLLNNYFFYLVFVLLIIYVVELLIFIKNVISKSLKMPSFTAKTILLTFLSFTLIIFYFLWAAEYLKIAYWKSFFVYLLIFDILLPLIISGIVLIFQPLFVFTRNIILQKAKLKIANFKNLTVIGITGSYGKTSTKEFLTTILSSKFNVLATPEHKNSEIGIAQTILKSLNDKHQIFIVEMGAYNKGGIELLCNMVKPKIGVVTGVNEQHLATFGSMENLLAAEGGGELVSNLPKDGLIVLNGDNKYCLDLYKSIEKSYLTITKKIYTTNYDKINSHIWTEDIEVRKNSLSFITMTRLKEMTNFKVDILGKHNVQNLLAAILIAKELKMSFGEISDACKNITQKQAGILLKRGVHSMEIIDSSYSSNPDGVTADLDYLNVFDGKKIIIMPCLIELGKKSAEIHNKIGGKIAQICDMAIITTKEQFENIKMGAMQNGMLSSRIIFLENPKEIFHLITTNCKAGDAILLEGRVPSEVIKLLVKS